MTAATQAGQRGVDRSEQVELLRRRIAAISGKVGSGYRGVGGPDTAPPASHSLLPAPETQAGQLPGPLPRGSVAVLSGARSLLVNMVATVTAAGGHAAIIAQPDIGLLAAVEMGADLTRLAVIPDPGGDPVEVAAVLMDGMDLVALGLGGYSVPPTRARAVVARARQKGCTLLVSDGDWPGASARLDARVCGYELAGAGRGVPTPGCGRISRVRLAVRTRGRGFGGSGVPGRAVGE